jgi:parvulin-like peptidyl-prolyl isomerase
MRSYLIIVLLLALSSKLFSQIDESVVAQVGNEKITAKDFKVRFELSPYIPEHKDIETDSIKYDFLYSLIAEKLWAMDAEKMRIVKTRQFDFYFKPIEDLFVRDALFKQEVENKVIISQSEIEKGINKSQFIQVVRFISSQDSVSIFEFHKQLISLANIDSLIPLFNSIDDTTIDVKFGDLDSETIEDTIYSLKKGNFSSPLQVNNGWIIFFCKDNVFTPLNLGDQQAVENIRKPIKRRKLEILYNEYRNNLLKGTNVKINPNTLVILSNVFWQRLKDKTPVVREETNYFELIESDFKEIQTAFTEAEFKSTLFNIKEKQILLYDLLSKVAYTGFSIIQLDSNLVLSKLAYISKRFVEEQILTDEGYKKGYNLLPQVKSDLNLWRQKYLAQMYLVSMLDSIKLDEDMLYRFYNEEFLKALSNSLVKLQMITLNDLDEISLVLDKMNAGVDFSEIAKYYGKTDSLVNQNGETDLIPVSLLGDLSNTVSGLNLNEIFGPIKRSNGYSIIKLIEKKETTDSLSLNYNEIKVQLRNALRFQKLKEKLNEKTADLSIQQNVKIYNDVLDKITSTNIQMFVHRFMGFGGRMAAVPLLTPFSGWMNNEVKQKLLP